MKSHHLKAAIVAFIFTFALTTNAHALFGFGKYTTVEPVNGFVTIPLADVSDGDAHYYVLNGGDQDIKFFLLKSSDGIVRAAFDACDVCFREHKGYTQNGDFMVCNNCGQKFHSSRINEVQGGCNPSPLQRTFDKDNVIINIRDIMAGRGYF